MRSEGVDDTGAGLNAMETVLEIIREAGGVDKVGYLNIENLPFMRLVIEVLPERGPDGYRVVSIAHYGELNGDAMRDPEVCAEVVDNGNSFELCPFSFRNDYVGSEEHSRWRDRDDLVCLPRKTSELRAFMKLWDANLRTQGFLDAFLRSHVRNGAPV
jgi:hypothetical protein